MGNVIITLRVSPNLDYDFNSVLEKVKEEINKFGGKYLEYKEVPIAFGIKVYDIKFLYPDKEFNEDELLEKIRSIEGIEDCEIVGATLSSI